MAQTLEIRHGERNFLRAGDRVRVRPSAPGKHDGFPAVFKYADEDKGGLYYCVMRIEHVSGRDVGAGYRFLKPGRVKRKASTRDPRR